MFFKGRRLLPVLSVAMLALPARAERKPVAFGLVGGLSAASFWGEDVHEIDFELRPAAGFTVAFHLPVFLGAELDALYFSKSGALDGTVDGKTKVDNFRLHYLEFPLLLKITAPTESETRPIFLVGVSLARAILKESSSEFITGTGGIINPEPTTPLIAEEDLDDFEVNLSVGGGLEWGLGTLQLRLSLGQSSIDGSGAEDIRNVLLAVLAGFIF